MRNAERVLPIAIAVIIASLAVCQIVYAQNVNCPAQTVFDQCKQNEDNYLRTCKQNEYACLCKWQKAKVSCWDTCPEDREKETQKTLMMTYCSQPGANVTLPTSSMPSMSSSTLLPSASSSSSSSSASATPSAGSDKNAGSAMLPDNQALWLSIGVLAMTAASAMLM